MITYELIENLIASSALWALVIGLNILVWWAIIGRIVDELTAWMTRK